MGKLADSADDAIVGRLALAVSIAREAGQSTLEFFRRSNFAVERKSDASPVTVADRQAELLLRERIAAAFPDDGIVGEEFGERAGKGLAASASFRWILDPIDGTKSFISGVPLYGTLIGIEMCTAGADDGTTDARSVIGVIDMPALGERVWAAAGQGAWYDDGDGIAKPAKVSNKSLSEGLFLTSQVDSFAKTGRHAALERLQAAASITRTWGDCYGYLLVATGRAEAMVDPVMNVWDAASMLPILEEAGGTFTDWKGARTVHGGEGIATNGRALDEVLRLVRE
jgi:histidinol phosphatase-like enzyme (inositol monophosphatase family)